MLHGLICPYTKLASPESFSEDLHTHWRTLSRNQISCPYRNPDFILTERIILYSRPAAGFTSDNFKFIFPYQKTYFGDQNEFIRQFKYSFRDVDFDDFLVAQAFALWLETTVLRLKEFTVSKKEAEKYVQSLKKNWFLPHMTSLDDMSENTLSSTLYNVKMIQERQNLDKTYHIDAEYLSRYISKLELELTTRRFAYLRGETSKSTR
jgi:hypothetical protein